MVSEDPLRAVTWFAVKVLDISRKRHLVDADTTTQHEHVISFQLAHQSQQVNARRERNAVDCHASRGSCLVPSALLALLPAPLQGHEVHRGAKCCGCGPRFRNMEICRFEGKEPQVLT